MSYLDLYQPDAKAFSGFVSNDIISRISKRGEWEFGRETLSVADQYFLQSSSLLDRIEIGLINDPSCNATWFPSPGIEDGYVIGINRGLMDTLMLIAYDVFGHGDEDDDEEIQLGFHDEGAVDRVKERLGTFLEIGYPLGDGGKPSPRRRDFVEAILEDAYQFVILHEFAHIALMHERGDVRVLRSKYGDTQIATFSIGQEHQADRLACRFHSAIRRNSTQRYPGMEFAGPTLYLGVLGLFERHLRYARVFDNPHSHPPAYERLHRLRVKLSTGDGHQYWNVKSDGGVKLARMEFDANPEAIRFADALSASLLAVLEGVEAAMDLPSPLLSLVNRFGDQEVSESSKVEFRSEICRWLALGSPRKVVQHLREGHRSAVQNVASVANESDRAFWANANAYLADAIEHISQIRDRTVQDALLVTKLEQLAAERE